MLTLAEAAELLRVHPNTMYQLASSGQIPCRRVGRQYRFTHDVLIRWLGGEDAEEDDGPQAFALVSARPNRPSSATLH